MLQIVGVDDMVIMAIPRVLLSMMVEGEETGMNGLSSFCKFSEQESKTLKAFHTFAMQDFQ